MEALLLASQQINREADNMRHQQQATSGSSMFIAVGVLLCCLLW